MKKLAALLSFAFAFALICTACSAEEPESTSTLQPTSEPTIESVQVEDPEPDGTGTLGDFDVEILGARLSEDYEGNKVIIVTYNWTNNSEETTSAYVTLTEKAFQDGIQLDSAIVTNDDSYDMDAQLKEIRPGATLEVQKAFVLDSDTSTVEVEITEWISFSDDVVMMTFDPATL